MYVRLGGSVDLTTVRAELPLSQAALVKGCISNYGRMRSCSYAAPSTSGQSQAMTSPRPNDATGEAKLAARRQAPTESTRISPLAEVLLARPSTDDEFWRALESWRQHAEPNRASMSVENTANTTSGGTQLGPVLQGPVSSNVSFGADVPAPPVSAILHLASSRNRVVIRLVAGQDRRCAAGLPPQTYPSFFLARIALSRLTTTSSLGTLRSSRPSMEH